MKFFSAPCRCNFSSEGTSEISRLRSGWSFVKNIFQVLKGRRKFSNSIVLSGQNFLRTIFQTLRVWLISGGRSATPFALATILFFSFSANAQTTNNLSDAEIQGRQLAQEILEQHPTENTTNTGFLEIHAANQQSRKFPLKFKVIVTTTNWESIYEVFFTNGAETMMITWPFDQSKEVLSDFSKGENIFGFHNKRIGYLGSFKHSFPTNNNMNFTSEKLRAESFAGSDFSLTDLRLEFFHWPEQKILKKEMHRSRGCTVLESTNPNPSPNGYSRVVSWIDEETLGIVEAYAYDARGKLLKDFYPKDFKKVRGQWQVQTLVMENVQTGSKSRLEFDLKPK